MKIFSKIIIKLKKVFSVKFKIYIKKFRNFNGYEGLDKRMLKYINYSNDFILSVVQTMGLTSQTHGILKSVLIKRIN